MESKLNQNRQKSLEILVHISEELIRFTSENIDYNILLDFMLQLSAADFALLNMADETDPKLQTTVAAALNPSLYDRSKYEDKCESLKGSTWQNKEKELLWEEVTTEYTFKLPGKPFEPSINFFNSIEELFGETEISKKLIWLNSKMEIERLILVKILDEHKLLGNFILVMCSDNEFQQHYAVKIFARQLSQLFIRRNKERKIDSLLKENEIIFNSTQDMLTLVKKIGYNHYEYQRVNDAFIEQTGLEREEIIGKQPQMLFTEEHVKDLITYFNNAIIAEVPISYSQNFELDSGDKSFQFTITPVHFEQNDYVVMSVRDITIERSNQERVEYLSFHDQLTGLYNRHYFNHSLRRLDNSRNLPLSLIMIDVNGLKLVNDAFGHLLGDQLLQAASETISSHSRSDDIVCRIGGDEFVFLLPQTDEKQIKIVMKRLKEASEDIKVGPFQLSFAMGGATRLDMDITARELLQYAEEEMYKNKLVESPFVRLNAVKTISEMMLTIPFEHEHAQTTALLAVGCASCLDWAQSRLDRLEQASLHHDIGKISVPVEIINKGDSLNDREITLLRRHAETGYRILDSVTQYADIAEFVLAHHERWDGKGYPRGLNKKDIPLESRIIAIADAYDVMTSARPWREPFTCEQALEELRAGAGTQFDPQLVDLFIKNEIYKLKQATQIKESVGSV